jgi:hypothetical protein
MTIDQFRQIILDMAQERTGLEAYGDYLKHKRLPDKTNPHKYLREEYLPILAVLDDKKIPGDEEIELGDEKQEWDARVSKTELFEVVQAVPANEHEIRLEIASGGARPETHAKHDNDHLQFPGVIVEAIDSKHAKHYTDQRTLIVAFDGDYSFEDDDVIRGWVDEVRRRTTRGTFKEILLVERARLKVFRLF